MTAVPELVGAGLGIAAGRQLGRVGEVPDRAPEALVDPNGDVVVLRRRGDMDVATAGHDERVVSAATVAEFAERLAAGVCDVLAVGLGRIAWIEDEQGAEIAVRRAVKTGQAAYARCDGNRRVARWKVGCHGIAVASNEGTGVLDARAIRGVLEVVGSGVQIPHAGVLDVQRTVSGAVVPGWVERLGGRQNDGIGTDRRAQERRTAGNTERAGIGREMQVGWHQVARRHAGRRGTPQTQLAREGGCPTGVFPYRCRVDGGGVARVPVVDVAAVGGRWRAEKGQGGVADQRRPVGSDPLRGCNARGTVGGNRVVLIVLEHEDGVRDGVVPGNGRDVDVDRWPKRSANQQRHMVGQPDQYKCLSLTCRRAAAIRGGDVDDVSPRRVGPVAAAGAGHVAGVPGAVVRPGGRRGAGPGRAGAALNAVSKNAALAARAGSTSTC